MSSVKSGGKNDIRYEVVGRRETERSGMELSIDILRKAKRKRYWIFITSAAALISVLHFYLFTRHLPLVVFEELYYIPLFLGAFWFGSRGALAVYVLVSLFYLPFFFGDGANSALGLADRVLHLIFSGVFTFTIAFFVDRERKRGQEAEREKYLAGIGQVATAIVHDLKNPLIAILGLGQRIQEGKVNTDAAVQVIMNSARSMERIVNDVLDFARPIRLELKDEDVRTIVSRVYDLSAKKAEEKGVFLPLDLPAESVPVAMDGEQMQRALINLFNNAIEASDAGQKVVLTVTDAKSHLDIRIKDQGSGMDKEALQTIFTPFFTTKKGGTGLGLPIAKKIIEAHKGTIRVESQQGTGTEVRIQLPHKDGGPQGG
jgi:two-component system, NtrC family, sensor histidine kinase HydH